MGLSQLTPASSYTGTVIKYEFSGKLPPYNSLTLMGWLNHTGGTGDAYSEIGGFSDDNDVGALSSTADTGTRRVSLGDLNSDTNGTRAVADNAWNHWCMVLTPNGANVDGMAYLDGIFQVAKASILTPVVPVTLRLLNTRASTTDTGGQWIGHACAFKVWDHPLSELEIRKEMRFWRAQKRAGLFAEVPMFDVDSRTLVTGGYYSALTVMGTYSAGFDPPGVLRDAPLVRRHAATYSPAIYDLEQYAYRFYADDGDEDGSTALAAETTGITRATATNTRLRVGVDVTDNPDALALQLEWKLSSDGTWRAVR